MKKRILEVFLLTFVMFAAFSWQGIPVLNAEEVPNPTVIGPIPVNVSPGDPLHDYTFFTPIQDLSEYGYVQEEFFFEGYGNRYDTPLTGGIGETGSIIPGGPYPYKTRMVVRRPISAKRFNGTVLLEWQNVTAGYEIDAHWAPSWDHFMRAGYAWVGVSAQRVGVHGFDPPGPSQVQQGLRTWSPIRYGTLDVTAGGLWKDDSLSYDIFSQAAQSIRSPMEVDPMGGLPVELIIAIGASQSERFLVTYHNSIHPLYCVFDGFYLLVGIGRKVRTDLDVRVFKVNTETDVLFLGEAAARQDDSDHLRTWEIAGAAHSGYASATYRAPIIERDDIIAAPVECSSPPYSRVRSEYVINSAYDHLVRWVHNGTPPPIAPRLDVVALGPPVVIARDSLGLALGGIRLPDVAVPIALNQGVNSGSGFCFLYGTFQPFDDETLRSLYRNHGAYVSAFNRSVNENLNAGYILKEAAVEMRSEAARSKIPPK